MLSGLPKEKLLRWHLEPTKRKRHLLLASDAEEMDETVFFSPPKQFDHSWGVLTVGVARLFEVQARRLAGSTRWREKLQTLALVHLGRSFVFALPCFGTHTHTFLQIQ